VGDVATEPGVEPIRNWVLVWRKNHRVFHVGVDRHEARALQCVLEGQPLGTALEAFGACSGPIKAATRAVGSWLSEELLVLRTYPT
jgi:hypothetical protein